MRAALTSALLGVLLNAGAVRADESGEVEIFDGPVPSAEELGKILYAEPSAERDSTRGIRTRGIMVSPSGKEAQAAEERPRSFGFLIRFGFDSYEILPDSRPYIDEVGRMLNLKGLADKRLVIVGHTDASGSRAYNLKLSRRRAEEIRNYLVTNHRVDRTRLQALGRGESQPLRGNDPYDARNRRVEFRSTE